MSEETSSDAVKEFKALMADPAARQAFVEVKARAAEDGAARRYSHILRAVASTPWAIQEDMLLVIVDILALRAAGGRLSAEEIDGRIAGLRRPPLDAAPNGVAVVPLHGVIIPKAGGISEMSGGTSIQQFRANFRTAIADKTVSAVVLDVDSPGGMVDQVPEMAAEIRAARGTKPIVAVANTEANSAAYWLASQADEIVASPSSRLGSVGVLMAHKDESVQAEAAGVKTTLISAGKFKTEGNPFEPLSPEAKGNLQAMVNHFYAMFTSDIARARHVGINDVRSGFGEGRVVLAQDAVEMGMADRIGTLEQVVAEQLTAHREHAVAAYIAEARPGLIGAGMNTNGTLEAYIEADARAQAHLDADATILQPLEEEPLVGEEAAADPIAAEADPSVSASAPDVLDLEARIASVSASK